MAGGTSDTGGVHTQRSLGGFQTEDESEQSSSRSPASRVRTVNPAPQLLRQASSDSQASEASERNPSPSLNPPPLSERKIQQQPLTTATTPANLGQRGTLDLESGGKIIYTRTNGGDLPTSEDELLGNIAALEESGELDADQVSKAKKLLSVMRTGLNFLMHNREFQTGVGLLGIGLFVGFGCAFPVLLVAAGPFIVIFAVGFIDNPMLTAPEGQKPAPENPIGEKGKGETPNPAGKSLEVMMIISRNQLVILGLNQMIIR